MKRACPVPELSDFLRYRPRLSAEDLCEMLGILDTDGLGLNDHYPEGDLDSILEDSSAKESEARFRSRENGHGIQPGGDEPQINLANGQFKY